MANIKILNPSNHRKADLIRNLLNQDATITRGGACALYDDPEMFSAGHFHAVRAAWRAEQENKETEEAPKTPKAPAMSGKVDVVDTLRLENAYLRWLLEGERRGFLDKWLEEQKDG
jgi:hypothetical protein